MKTIKLTMSLKIFEFNWRGEIAAHLDLKYMK